MIELYTTGAPNGRKITIFCEETDLPYRVHVVDLYRQENRHPEFLAINPNGRIPAIVDPDGPGGPLTLWESGAILQYLADKTGRFLPEGAARWEVLKWLFFQISHAPYWGLVHMFRYLAPEPDRFAIDRYSKEARRHYRLLDARFAEVRYLGGDDYSIADMALYPWIEYAEWHSQQLDDHPNLSRWFDEVGARPAVQKGRANPWPSDRWGPTEEGRRAFEIIHARMKDPAFAPDM